MTYADLFEYVDKEPFEPFRIRMASGRVFDIRHPENILIGESSVRVLVPSAKDERLFEKLIGLGYSLMESLEPLEAVASVD